MAVDYRVLFPGLDCESYRNCQNESLAVIGCRDHMTHYMGSNLHEMFHSSIFWKLRSEWIVYSPITFDSPRF